MVGLQTQLYCAKNYTMKCRLYPNQAAKKMLDAAIHAIHEAHNIILYNIVTNQNHVKECVKNDEVVHFVKWNEYAKAAYLHEALPEWIFKSVPNGALSSNNGVVLNDMKRSFTSLKGKQKAIEWVKPKYYNNNKPRQSFTYQITGSRIELSENKNVLFVLFSAGAGKKYPTARIKCKGWNQKMRFDEDGEVDFRQYLAINPRKQITITIIKDTCGDYFIAFKLANVWLKANRRNDLAVGVSICFNKEHFVTCSDGTVMQNECFRVRQEARIQALNQQMSRRWGYANPEFRKKRQATKDENGKPTIQPSKRYLATLQKYERLHRKITRQRMNQSHVISKQLQDYGSLAVEQLQPKRLARNKKFASLVQEFAVTTLVDEIAYKANWYQRDILLVDPHKFPIEATCSACKHPILDVAKNAHPQICSNCGREVDRYINTAENLKQIIE